LRFFDHQVESFMLFLMDQERARELRGLVCSPQAINVLTEGQKRIRNKINVVVFPMLERWYQRCLKRKEMPKACILRAHLAYIFRNITEEEPNYTNVSTILCSQVFLTINFHFDVDISLYGEARDRGGPEDDIKRDLGVPQLEVFNVFTMHRAKILAWLRRNPSECDEVMESVIRIVTMTGPREKPRDRDQLKSRHWESMTRHGCVGRFLPDTELKGVMEMIKVRADGWE